MGASLRLEALVESLDVDERAELRLGGVAGPLATLAARASGPATEAAGEGSSEEPAATEQRAAVGDSEPEPSLARGLEAAPESPPPATSAAGGRRRRRKGAEAGAKAGSALTSASSAGAGSATTETATATATAAVAGRPSTGPNKTVAGVKFDPKKVRGLHDDDDAAAEAEGRPRRRGTVVFAPRGDEGWICWVEDDGGADRGWGDTGGGGGGEDSVGATLPLTAGPWERRACALRTIEDLRSQLEARGEPLLYCAGARHPCTFVAGVRPQRWARLGGIVPGLTGETAIAVRLDLKVVTDGAAVGAAAGGEDAGGEPGDDEFVVPPRGSFRRFCNCCKAPYVELHRFYHQVRLLLP